uniref:Uncharacterized protein n=1 Tax=Ciona intestinalis TaxID=7719 RepID=F6VA61_CIOIN
ACEAISKLSDLRSVILALLSASDTRTLLETVRLLRTCLADQKSSNLWVETAEENVKDLHENSIFILSCSTNGKLLSSLSEVLDQLFKLSPEKVLEKFSTKEFVASLLEALGQLY